MGGGVQRGPLGTSATHWPIVPAPGDYDDGEFGGMKIGKGNLTTRREPTPTPLCPLQISLDQTRARTRAAAVGSQPLTAWAMARPILEMTVVVHVYKKIPPYYEPRSLLSCSEDASLDPIMNHKSPVRFLCYR